MNDEAREPHAPPPPPPMGVDRVEFRRGLNDLHRGQQELARLIFREAGGVLVGLGLFLVITGYFLLRDAGS